MLPIFRVLPVGGVFLAIAILLLALSPPRETSSSASVALSPARGPLLDRAEHPEWRQFMIQGAVRRAGEVALLRDLPDSAIPGAPATSAAKPTSHISDSKSAAAEPVDVRPRAVAAKAAEPNIADAEHQEAKPQATPKSAVTPTPAAPAKADAAKVADTAPVKTQSDEAKDGKPGTAGIVAPAAQPAAEAATGEPKLAAVQPTATEPGIAAPPAAAPVAAKLKADEPKLAKAAPGQALPTATEPPLTDVAPVAVTVQAAAAKPVSALAIVAMAKPIASTPSAITPAPIAVAAAPARAHVASMTPAAVVPVVPPVPSPKAPAKVETNGSHVAVHGAPAAAKPAPIELAALPAQPVQSDDDLVTGSIDARDHDPTIPVGIGEASSTELPVMLPRERPPVLRRLDRRHAHQSRSHRASVPAHRAARATSKPVAAAPPPPFDLFALLFKDWDADAKAQVAAQAAKPTVRAPPGRRSEWINR